MSWLGQPAYIDAAYRVDARAEDAIRTGQDCGIGKSPPPGLPVKLPVRLPVFSLTERRGVYDYRR